ncbi:hypothetical protein YC2023_014085 [Brassica napus]
MSSHNPSHLRLLQKVSFSLSLLHSTFFTHTTHITFHSLLCITALNHIFNNTFFINTTHITFQTHHPLICTFFSFKPALNQLLSLLIRSQPLLLHLLIVPMSFIHLTIQEQPMYHHNIRAKIRTNTSYLHLIPQHRHIIKITPPTELPDQHYIRIHSRLTPHLSHFTQHLKNLLPCPQYPHKRMVSAYRRHNPFLNHLVEHPLSLFCLLTLAQRLDERVVRHNVSLHPFLLLHRLHQTRRLGYKPAFS